MLVGNNGAALWLCRRRDLPCWSVRSMRMRSRSCRHCSFRHLRPIPDEEQLTSESSNSAETKPYTKPKPIRNASYLTHLASARCKHPLDNTRQTDSALSMPLTRPNGDAGSGSSRHKAKMRCEFVWRCACMCVPPYGCSRRCVCGCVINSPPSWIFASRPPSMLVTCSLRRACSGRETG
jgi:hypothetical protein